MKASELIRIMQFADSALPIGGFTFSNGVEAAIQAGVVRDVATLKEFIQASLQQTATCDGIALIAAHRHILNQNLDQIIETDWAVYNRKLNEESRLMTVRMGKKLTELSAHVIEDSRLVWWLEQIKENNTPGTQPVTQAILMALQNINEQNVLVMHQYSIAMTILSASIRLMRITHYETQRILFELTDAIEDSCHSAACGDISQMSSYMPIIDVLSALHTKSFVRLFMN